MLYLNTHSMTLCTVGHVILTQTSTYEASGCESNTNLISCFWVTNHRLIQHQTDLFGRTRQWPNIELFYLYPNTKECPNSRWYICE